MFAIVKNNKILYRAVLWVLLISSILLLARLAPIFTVPEYLHSDDFIRYWASGKLNLQGENPYALDRMIQLQREVGDTIADLSKAIVLNPPWAITMLMPFGLLDYSLGRLAWLFLSIILILVSTLLLWRIYSGNPKQRWLPILIVFIFAPTISVLEVGQISALPLFGIVGFLYFSSVVRNDWLAGISLAIIAIKPQLILLFWIALLFWVIQQRRWKIIIGTAITTMALTLIAMVVNPKIISQYLGMLQTYKISDWANPTIGSYLRYYLFGINRFWLQFLPMVLGGIWLTYYWYRHHKNWNWIDELPIILLVSIIVSPYSWTYDFVILIPAVVLATVWIAADWKHWTTWVLMVMFLAISLLDLVLHMKLDEFWFIWVAPALFIWFLLVRWLYSKSHDSPSLPAA